VCGNEFRLRQAGVEVRDANDATMFVGNVCLDCLGKTDEEIRRHLIVHAERLEEDARFFRALAEEGLLLPTRGHFAVFEEEVNKHPSIDLGATQPGVDASAEVWP
jgi:hypothetical protein